MAVVVEAAAAAQPHLQEQCSLEAPVTVGYGFVNPDSTVAEMRTQAKQIPLCCVWLKYWGLTPG